MPRPTLTFLLLFIINHNLFAQTGSVKAISIDTYFYQTNDCNVKSDSFSFSLDGVLVKGKISGHDIVTTNYFGKDSTNLIISYSLKGNRVNFVGVVEYSKNFRDMHRYSHFYFKEGFIVAETHRSLTRACMAIPVDMDYNKLFGYSSNITIDFMRAYIFTLYREINKNIVIKNA